MSVLYSLRMRRGLLLFLLSRVMSVAALTWTDTCGGNIDIHAADYLTSPGYPSAYPSSQQCVWVITAPESGQKILINFNPHFDLEDRDCNSTPETNPKSSKKAAFTPHQSDGSPPQTASAPENPAQLAEKCEAGPT